MIKDRKDCASGILPLCATTHQVCLAWRSPEVNDGDRWGVIGGMMKEGLSPTQNAIVELGEEIGYVGPIELIPAHSSHRVNFVYHTFVGIVPAPFVYDPQPEHAWETTHILWVSYEQALEMVATNPKDFHNGMIELFHSTKELLPRLIQLNRFECL